MAKRECTTQAEVDAAIAAGDMVILRGSARAMLYGSARATLYGSARATLFDSASATLFDSASATLFDSARATLYGSAHATLYDSARATEGETGRVLLQSRPVVLIGPIGSRHAMLSIYQCADGTQLIRAGCSLGTRDEFAAAVAKTHPSGQYAAEYAAALAFIDAMRGQS